MEATEEIKERLSVDEVVGGYVQLRQAGRNFKGLCPFHDEKTPSFVVSPDKGIYHCFGCGAGGDIFTFVQQMDGLEFRAALERLAGKAGVELPATSGQSQQQKQQKQRLREALAAAARYYHIQLGRDEEAKQYVKEGRGFNDETIKTFRIGYAPDGGRRLLQFLRKHGFEDQELKDAGLARSRSGGLQDMFRERIMIPFFDVSGDVIGFTGRALGDGMPKYLNSPQNPVFDKSRFVFGLYQAKESIRSRNEAVVAEGNLDVLQAHQAQTPYVVAMSGTALTQAQIKQIGRLADTITFAFDADAAGMKAIERALPLVQDAGLDLYIATLPAGKDPDDVIREHPGQWREILESKAYVMDWLLLNLAEMYDLGTAQGKRELTNRAAAVLGRVRDEVEQEHYAQQLADMAGVAPATIIRKIKTAGSTTPSTSERSAVILGAAPLHDETETVLQALLSICATYPDTRHALGEVATDTLPESAQQLVEFLKTSDTPLESAAFPEELQSVENYANILLLRGEESYGSWASLDRQVEAFSLTHRLKELQTKRQKQLLSQQIAAAETDGNDELRKKLLEQFNNLK